MVNKPNVVPIYFFGLLPWDFNAKISYDTLKEKGK